MSVESIKEAIAELPPEEKTALAAWLLRQDMEAWDRQIEQDFSSCGRGMALLDEAEADALAGRVEPMDQFLTEVKSGRVARKPRS